MRKTPTIMKSPRLWSQWMVGLAVLGMVAAFVWPRESRSRRNSRRAACQSNLRQIALASLQYVKDYDGFLPPISSGEMGWADLLLPYSKSWAHFGCSEGQNAEKEQCTDYFLNARLTQNLRVQEPEQTISFGDGLDNSPTKAQLWELPINWKDNSESPAMRHFEGANYAFVDGHVRWLQPTLIDGRDGITQYSFEVER